MSKWLSARKRVTTHTLLRAGPLITNREACLRAGSVGHLGDGNDNATGVSRVRKYRDEDAA